MPVSDGFVDCFIRLNGLKLRQRHSHGPALPFDKHDHVAGAGFFGGHALNFHRLSFEERRNRLGRDTRGLKRESDFVLQVVVPTHGLLLRAISIHHNLIVDSLLPHRVPFEFCHCSYFCLAARIRRTEVRPMFRRRAISDLLMPARWSFRTWSAWRAAVGGLPSFLPFCRACARPARTRSCRI